MGRSATISLTRAMLTHLSRHRKNDPLWRRHRIRPTPPFSRFPPVHWASVEGRQRVDTRRSQLAYPVHPSGYPKTRLALQPPFELLLFEPVVVEAPENRRQTSESPDQLALCGDEAADESE